MPSAAAAPPRGLHPEVARVMRTHGLEVANTQKVRSWLPERLRNSSLLMGGDGGRSFIRAKVDPSLPGLAPSGNARSGSSSVTVKATITNDDEYRRAYAFAKDWGLLQREETAGDKRARDFTAAWSGGAACAAQLHVLTLSSNMPQAAHWHTHASRIAAPDQFVCVRAACAARVTGWPRRFELVAALCSHRTSSVRERFKLPSLVGCWERGCLGELSKQSLDHSPY